MSTDEIDGHTERAAMRTGGKTITPVIMSGGSGSRLWPLSRERYPKQLISLCSERTMIQDTAVRVREPGLFREPLIICNVEHRFVIAEQLRRLDIEPAGIVLEPEGRNTAPAAAVAALLALEADPEAVILLLPADHLIRDTGGFRDAVARALPAAEAGHLVTFGIQPTAPETGYGYIEQGDGLAGHSGVHAVAAFAEKPPLETARAYLEGGRHFWNSGMFLFKAAVFLAELDRFEPGMVDAARAALSRGGRDLDFFRLDAGAFGGCRNVSIDYAVMERTAKAAVVPCDIGWTDVGAWSALWEVGGKDEQGNVAIGDALLIDTRDSYVRSETMLTAVVGLRDVVVVVTEDAALVAARDQVQNVKAVVDALKKAGRRERLEHVQVHRPWGYYQSVHQGDGFQVKRITVLPGQRLSLQMHRHRAEHWVVVSGTALVTRGEEQLSLKAGESVHIPLGAVHRLENPGEEPLHLIEVQTGGYLGEDDIIRLQDSYGRN